MHNLIFSVDFQIPEQRAETGASNGETRSSMKLRRSVVKKNHKKKNHKKKNHKINLVILQVPKRLAGWPTICPQLTFGLLETTNTVEENETNAAHRET